MLMRPKAGPQSRRRFTAAWLSFLRLMAFIPIKHRLSNMSVTILVVDDNPDILSNVRDFLEIKGWRVETATTAADAWERLSREGIDLLILDIGLPGMDGMTLCRRIRINDKRLPILMLTARDAVDDRVEGLASGADDYLVKPFALRELGARVEAYSAKVRSGCAWATWNSISRRCPSCARVGKSGSIRFASKSCARS